MFLIFGNIVVHSYWLFGSGRSSQFRCSFIYLFIFNIGRTLTWINRRTLLSGTVRVKIRVVSFWALLLRCFGTASYTSHKKKKRSERKKSGALLFTGLFETTIFPRSSFSNFDHWVLLTETLHAGGG